MLQQQMKSTIITSNHVMGQENCENGIEILLRSIFSYYYYSRNQFFFVKLVINQN